jgi:hypothetical protein
MNQQQLSDLIARQLYRQNGVSASGLGAGVMHVEGEVDTAELADVILAAIGDQGDGAN